MSSQPDVSVCIVNWNGGEPVLALIGSVEASEGLDVEIVVVDNGSTDGSPDAIAQRFPGVRLLRNQGNRGFAAANNQAVEVARGRTLFFLNNDTLLPPGTLAGLVEHLQRSPEVVAVGPRLVGPDGEAQDSNGSPPTFRGLLHRVRFLRWTGAFREAYEGYRRSHSPVSGPVERLGGAALLVRAGALEGPLWDADYRFGLEDVDLSCRLRRVGRIEYVNELTVEHQGGRSSKSNVAFVHAGFEEGFARFLAKHDPRRWPAFVYALLVTLDLPLRILLQALYALALSVRRPEDAAAARGLLGAQLRFAFGGLPRFWRAAQGPPWPVSPTRDLFPIVLLTVAAFALRLASGARAAVISRDGAAYMDLAREFLAGNWSAGLAHHYPPLYPLLLALGGLASGEVTERGSILITALAAAALVPAVALLAARCYGRTAALFAALLAAILPLFTELGGEILADSLHLMLVAWTIVLLQHVIEGGRRAPLAAVGAALVGAAAYLVRPEALVVVGCGWFALLVLPRPAGTRVRRRFADAAWMALPALLALVPFLLFIKGQNTIDGTGSGTFKLTLKQNLGDMLSKLTLEAFGGNVVETVRLWGKSLGPGVVLAAVAALGPRAAGRGGAGRRLAFLCAALGALLLVTFALIRADRRFVAVLVLLALPHAGWGATIVARWLAARRRAAQLTVALVLLALCLPFSLRTVHARKASYRVAGALLADAGARTVLARDSRPGYYAGAVTLPLLYQFPGGDPPSARALAEVIESERPDALVLIVDHPAKERMSEELMASLPGATRVRLRSAGTLPIDVFLLPN